MNRIFNSLLLIFLFSACLNPAGIIAQENITWLSWQAGVEKSNKEGKQLLVKIYRKDCNWCRQMDRSTFSDPKIQKYIHDNFIPVLLPFELKKSLRYKSKSYNYTESGNQGYHELALDLSGGRYGTPGVVFLDKNLEVLQSFIGYKDSSNFLAILKYYGDGHYLNIPWHKFNAIYVKEKG